MASREELRQERLSKLKLLEEKGLNAYPLSTYPTATLKEVAEDFSKFEKKSSVTLVGRVMSIRGQGAIIFLTLHDGTGAFQAMFKKGDTDEQSFTLFDSVKDIGDFVELEGTLFLTKRNEKTILVKKWRMLSKALLPLPEKWHGLTDTEERFRRRYLDLIASPEVKERFILRSKMIREIRAFYDKEGFIEVETPRLQILAGGATAKPFKTHHNALDVDFYLTIAQELYLKQLLVGGINKVYEIGRKFRNEGIDVTHNPEFTMLESNEAYSDAGGQRTFIEKLFKQVVKKVIGVSKIMYDGNEIDFSKKFHVITFYELLKRYALIPNPETITKEDALLRAEQLGVKVAPTESLEKVLDAIYKKACRPRLVEPTFIVDYPVAFSPFSKRKEDDPTLIDRFQLVVGGLELVNAFSELNNPIDQKNRYLEEDKKGKEGESDISPSDKEYLEAMEHGMPPNGGIGIGIDRFAMLLTDQKNIREVIFFPTLRPK